MDFSQSLITDSWSGLKTFERANPTSNNANKKKESNSGLSLLSRWRRMVTGYVKDIRWLTQDLIVNKW